MNKEDILALLIKNVCVILPELREEQIRLSDALVDLGANSLDRAEIIALTMESLSLNIPRVELFGAKNIYELVDAFYVKVSNE